MRLVTWIPRHIGGPSAENAARIGVLVDGDPVGRGGRIVDLAEASGLGQVASIRRALDDGDLAALLAADPGLRQVRAAVEASTEAPGRAVARSDARILAPIVRPGKIICVGLNYRDHVEEHHLQVPERPILFSKFANAIVADGEPVVHHDRTRALDLEVELGVVIGATARRVRADDAMTYVAGYTTVNDVSARDLQGAKPALGPGERGDGQWLRAKWSDTFLPMGPVFVTADEVDAAETAIRSWVVPGSPGRMGEVGIPFRMQSANTSAFLFDIPYLVEFISAVITLEPGDLIITGTPAGVGVFRTPPVYVLPGDVMIVEIEGVGRLENPVVAADGRAPDGSPAARLIAAGA
jgi:2,4-diketo-3-deoxy-L-fuconate hydrolase